MVATRSPRAVSTGSSRAIRVVLPAPLQPAMPMTRVAGALVSMMPAPFLGGAVRRQAAADRLSAAGARRQPPHDDRPPAAAPGAEMPAAGPLCPPRAAPR